MSEISRVTRSKDEARSAYDRMSRWYDLFASSEKKFSDVGLSMLDVRSGERVLEIGFGTGDALLTLAQAAHPAAVFGIDLSPKMGEMAERKLSKAGLLDAVYLQSGDAAKLPFDDHSFDVLFMSFTLELFDTPEIPRVLDEVRRVLNDEGRVGVVALEKVAYRAVQLYEWFHEKMPRMVDCRPIHAKESLIAAGFVIEKEQMLTMWGLPVSILVARKTP